MTSSESGLILEMSREQALESMRAGLASLSEPDGTLELNGVDVNARCASPLLEAYVQPLLDAKNPNDLADAINKVQVDLFSLGIFKDVGVSMSQDKVLSIQLPAASKFVAKVGTNVGQSEGSGYIRGTVCNASGWGEIVTVDTSAGTRTRSSHLLNVSVPIPLRSCVGWKAETLAYSSERMFEWASSKAYVKGFTARFSKGLSHSFGLDAVLRTFTSTKHTGNPHLFRDAGNSLKTSIFHNWRYDTRVPTELIQGDGAGYMIDVHNEIAAAPSTSPFYKLLAKFYSSFELIRPVTGAFNAKLGFIKSLDRTQPTNFLDRFNLGGSLDLRGFRLNHAGPHANGDAIGGDFLCAGGFSLFTPIPKVASPNLKFHNFVNAGYLGSFVSPLPSVSTGFGVIYTHPSARFELNFVLPLVSHTTELVHKGLQLGVGLEFL